MRWIDVNAFSGLREHIEAAEKGELVLIIDGTRVMGYVGIPGRPLQPWEEDLVADRISASKTLPIDEDDPA